MNEHRPLRSYGRTRGRVLRENKQALVDNLLPQLQFDPKAPHAQTLWLEIGCGGGEHAAFQAQANPQVGYIGCEPYINGLSHLLQAIEDNNLKNIRIHGADARDLMAQLPDASIARAFILFPDPWPKTRHHKRRLIQAPFLAELARVMQAGARLRIATDHVDYLGWILAQMLSSQQFTWLANRHTDWSEMPADAMETRYQQKAAKEGRVATYLEFERLRG